MVKTAFLCDASVQSWPPGAFSIDSMASPERLHSPIELRRKLFISFNLGDERTAEVSAMLFTVLNVIRMITAISHNPRAQCKTKYSKTHSLCWLFNYHYNMLSIFSQTYLCIQTAFIVACLVGDASRAHHGLGEWVWIDHIYCRCRSQVEPVRWGS